MVGSDPNRRVSKHAGWYAFSKPRSVNTEANDARRERLPLSLFLLSPEIRSFTPRNAGEGPRGRRGSPAVGRPPRNLEGRGAGAGTDRTGHGGAGRRGPWRGGAWSSRPRAWWGATSAPRQPTAAIGAPRARWEKRSRNLHWAVTKLDAPTPLPPFQSKRILSRVGPSPIPREAECTESCTDGCTLPSREACPWRPRQNLVAELTMVAADGQPVLALEERAPLPVPARITL